MKQSIFKYEHIIAMLICLVAPYICLKFGFGDMLHHLDTQMIVASGDGYKNIYTPIYHYLYGTGGTFDGFLYPNGEYVLYTDGQPLVIGLLRMFKYLGLKLSAYQMLGLLQWLCVLSLWVGMYFMYRFSRLLNAPVLWAAIISVVCILLSPQIFRIKGHYGLSYAFTLPVIMYSLLRNEQNEYGRLGQLFIFFVYNFLIGFIHPYLLMINFLYIVSYEVVRFLKGDRSYWVLGFSTLSLALFFVVNKLVDPYSDRPEHPFGPYQYRSHFRDIFPINGWFNEWVLNPLNIERLHGEGYTYLGILLYIIPFLVLFFIYKIIKNKITLKSAIPTYLGAAIFIYFFATGKHISFTGGYIFKLLPPLEQFRALGRFIVAFYYPMFIFLAMWVYNAVCKAGKKYVRIGILSLIVVLWTIDIKNYWEIFNKDLVQYRGGFSLMENKNVADRLAALDVSSDAFQAIVPVPIMLEGAETFRDLKNWTAYMNALPYAFQTGSKVVGGIISRTAVTPASNSLQLMSLNNFPKNLLSNITDKRPFLLLANNESFAENYPDHIDKIEVLDTTDNLLLAKFYPERLVSDNLCTNDIVVENGWKYYNGFDDRNNEGLYSSGALKEGESDWIDEVSVPDSIRSIDFSIWYEMLPTNNALPEIRLEFLNEQKDKIGESYFSEMDLPWYREMVNNWIRIKKEDIQLPDGIHTVVVKKGGINACGHDHLILSSVKKFKVTEFSKNYSIVNHHFCNGK